MTLGQLAEAIGNIEESLNEIHSSEADSLLDNLNDNITLAVDSLGSGPLCDRLKGIQRTVETILAGYAVLLNINLEELAE